MGNGFDTPFIHREHVYTVIEKKKSQEDRPWRAGCKQDQSRLIRLATLGIGLAGASRLAWVGFGLVCGLLAKGDPLVLFLRFTVYMYKYH
jgi:hypothetical protein